MDAIATARRLRRDSTEAERLIWSSLRRRGVGGLKFRRQHPVGRYVVDFVCLERRLVVELDGGQHGSDAETDLRRQRWLERRGYRVLRIWNHEVLENPEGVCETIRRTALQKLRRTALQK